MVMDSDYEPQPIAGALQGDNNERDEVPFPTPTGPPRYPAPPQHFQAPPPQYQPQPQQPYYTPPAYSAAPQSPQAAQQPYYTPAAQATAQEQQPGHYQQPAGYPQPPNPRPPTPPVYTPLERARPRTAEEAQYSTQRRDALLQQVNNLAESFGVNLDQAIEDATYLPAPQTQPRLVPNQLLAIYRETNWLRQGQLERFIQLVEHFTSIVEGMHRNGMSVDEATAMLERAATFIRRAGSGSSLTF